MDSLQGRATLLTCGTRGRRASRSWLRRGAPHSSSRAADPFLDVDIHPLALQEKDIDDLVALMASLTSPSYRDLAATELARQRQLSRTSRPQRDSAKAFGPKQIQPRPPSF